MFPEHSIMKRKLLVSSILLGLTVAIPLGAFAQDQDQTTQKDKQLGTITVTGSLIPQAEVETASPVITISTQQLEKQGFGTVYDALRATPVATGAVQDNQFTGGFTPGAQTISLLGLDPGFTLYLINGHPLADYPLLYNGSSNFVDLTDIPVGMVDHIDILPGNQSSIYGSSAIAGVINIILKDHIDGYEINVRGGGYTGGGGSNERVEILGGNQWGDFSLNWGVQLSNQKPIWGYDRDLTASTLENPNPALRFGSRTFLHGYYNAGLHYIDPGQAACDPLKGLVGGTVSYQTRAGVGSYCGTQYDLGYSTILNENKSATGYANFKYKLSDSAELYGNALFSASSVHFSSGPYFWEGDLNTSGYFVNADTGNLELFQHLFSPEEVGNADGYSDHQIVHSYNVWGGVRGTVGYNNNWDYDIYYSRSQTYLDDKNPWPVASKVQSFFENQFLGPLLGTTSGYRIYSPNVSNFYKPITPAQYATFSDIIQTRSETWTQNVNIQVNNTDLFSMPAGAAGIAALIQVGNQAWSNPTDPRVIAGDFYGLTGTSGGGTRNNYAGALELRVPITSMLTADGSVRYDHYGNQDIGGGDSKSTYKVGLEFRPFESLLFRGNYATAFRAPDMAYTFGGQSGFFQGGNTDYYRCSFQNVPLENCTLFGSTTVQGVHTGNAALQSITAKSYGFGGVWSPTPDFNIKADYYNVKIDNEVTLQSVDTLLRNDSDCLLGNLDINSPTCKAAIAQVTRAPSTAPIPYAIQSVVVLPINIANEHVSGILASANYRYDMGRWGDLNLSGQYNVTLKHDYQQFPDDPTLHLLNEPYYSTEFKTIANASVTWNIDKFSATLFGTRYSSTPNYRAQFAPTGYDTPCTTGYVACPGKVAPWFIYNGSVSYNITDDIKVSGIVNNIRNTMPPKDSTYTAAPYYNFLTYNPYGRAYWLEIDWRFGRGGKD
jgi:outer membrane receptor protein involved in Fe transport